MSGELTMELKPSDSQPSECVCVCTCVCVYDYTIGFCKMSSKDMHAVMVVVKLYTVAVL